MRIDRIKLVSELVKQDMTQKRLAELAGISRATINYIKSGKRTRQAPYFQEPPLWPDSSARSLSRRLTPMCMGKWRPELARKRLRLH